MNGNRQKWTEENSRFGLNSVMPWLRPYVFASCALHARLPLAYGSARKPFFCFGHFRSQHAANSLPAKTSAQHVDFAWDLRILGRGHRRSVGVENNNFVLTTELKLKQ
jgi:hypothetical protein